MATIHFQESEVLGGSPVYFEELGGLSLKKVSRSVKSAARAPVKVTTRAVAKVKSAPVAKAVQKVSKAGKIVVRSPYIRVGAAGLAVVFPPAGVLAVAAVETANLVLSAAEKGQKQARAIIAATKQAAAAGDVAAKRGVVVLTAQEKARATIRLNHAAPKAGRVKPAAKAALKPAVSAALAQVQTALTPGTGRPPAGSVAVRGLYVTREGLVFRP